MKPLEIKLNKQYKELVKELEDYWCLEGNDNISKFCDEVARAEYFKIQETSKKFQKKGLKAEEYNDLLDEFSEEIDSFREYFYNEDFRKGFKKDVFELNEVKSKQIIDEIKHIEATAYYNNLQKLAYTINFRTWKTIANITYILNTITDEGITPYKLLIEEEMLKVKKIMDEYIVNLTKPKEDDSNNLTKIHTKKIFDYKKLDKLIKELGFEATRQTGSHKIYQNENGKSVPVPQHDLGKGLSFKIQKQIQI